MILKTNEVSGPVRGTLPHHDGQSWGVLQPGLAGQVPTSQGPGLNLIYQTPAAGGGAVPITTATYGATTTFALATTFNDKQQVTLTGNSTFALAGGFAGQVFLILVNYSGAYTFTWFSTIRWPGGVVPGQTSVGGKSDLYIFLCTGTGAYIGNLIGLGY